MANDFEAVIMSNINAIEESEEKLLSEVISVWKERNERESELVTKSLRLLSMGSTRKAYSIVSRTFLLTQQVARGQVEAMNREYGGFPLLEHEMGKISKQRWFTYIACVNSKTCLLLLVEGQQREEAKRRALIWIEKCPNRATHGQPVFVDLLGRVLEPADCREAIIAKSTE